MAYDIQLSDEWDMPANPQLIDDAQRVAQQIKITLQFWKGEWFLDTDAGVPYLERILVKNPNASHIRQVIQQQIASVDGVKSASIDSVLIDNRQRSAVVVYSAVTDKGLIDHEEVILGGNS